MKNHNNQKDEKKENEKIAQTECETLAEQTEGFDETAIKIDVDSLSDEEAKLMLKEVLEANDEISKELNSALTESAKFKDSWYRTAAEFENFKKRNDGVRRSAYDDGKIDAIKSLLLIGDSLDRALSIEMDEKTKSGVELIQRQFDESMKALGVEAINPVGETFSPEFSEAVAMVDAVEGENSGAIRTVFKKGYKLNGKTMRYAQVIVVK